MFLNTIFLPHFLPPPTRPSHCSCLEWKYCVLWKTAWWLCGKFCRGTNWTVCHPFVL